MTSLLFFFIAASIAAAQGDECPKSFTLDTASSRCYSARSNRLYTFQEAEGWCAAMGGRLPVVRTDADLSYFNERAPKTPEDKDNSWLGYWLGAKRSGSDFLWDDDTPVGKSNYYKDEPNNNGGTEDRLIVVENPSFSDKIGKWNDVPKDSTFYAICQHAALGEFQLCPSGFALDSESGRCYLPPTTTKMTFTNATKYCQDRKGRLPELTTDADIAFFSKRAAQSPDGKAGYWLGAKRKSNNKFYWSTSDQEITKSNYNTGEPNNAGSGEDKLEVLANPSTPKTRGKWNDVPGSLSKYVICQAVASTRKVRCPERYILDSASGFCYSGRSSSTKTYAEAKEWCKARNGHLPIYYTDQEVSFFKERAPAIPSDSTKGWLGYWAGAVRVGKGFQWEKTGTNLTITNFDKDEPNNADNKEDRIQISTNPAFLEKMGKWNDINSEQKNYAICQADQEIVTHKCRTGFTFDAKSSRCYSDKSSDSMSFSSASTWCAGKGARLPEVNTDEDLKYLNERVPRVPSSDDEWSGYWLNAVRDGSDFKWLSSGEKVTKSNYYTGEPNNSEEKEDRLQVLENPKFEAKLGKWNDVPGTGNNYAICQTNRIFLKDSSVSL